MSGSRKKGILNAHAAALLFGGTALFPKWITLPADVITFWRMVVSIVCVLCFCWFFGNSLRLKRKRDVWIQIGLGVILGTHWATYYASIQCSTVAIGVTALFTAPVFSVLLSSVLSRVWPDWIDLTLSGIVFFGVVLLMPSFSWEDAYTKGVLLGVLSAVFLAMRQEFQTRTKVRGTSGMVLLFYQLIGIGLLFGLSGFRMGGDAIGGNWVHLLVLGVFFTALPHMCNLNALRELEAKTVLIISSLMLPYGIVFSALLLDEIPTLKTVFGCALVLCAATVENVRARRETF